MTSLISPNKPVNEARGKKFKMGIKGRLMSVWREGIVTIVNV